MSNPASQSIGLYPDGPGKKVQAFSVTDENGVQVLRQVGLIGDPSDPLAVAAVKEGGTAAQVGDPGLVIQISPNGLLPAFAAPPVVSDMQSAPFAGAVPMTAGTTYTAQRSVAVIATAAGNLTFTFLDTSTLTVPVGVGWQTFPFACVAFSVPGSGGASASVYNLK